VVWFGVDCVALGLDTADVGPVPVVAVPGAE
jgi:hypothetical protein